MKKYLLIISALLCIIGFTNNVIAEELTVYEGTGTTSYFPVHGNYADYYQHIQIIYSASDLSLMEGQNITGMTFYISSPASTAWTGTFTVSIKETDDTDFGDTTYPAPGFKSTSGLTTVYSGKLDATKSNLEITFNSPFEYTGGNLLYNLETATKGNYTSASFYTSPSVYTGSVFCIEGHSSSSLASISSSNNQLRYRPKTTFTYETAAVCPKIKDIAVSNLTATGAHISWSGKPAADSYAYRYVTHGSTVNWTGAPTTSNTYVDLTGLTPDQEYDFYVKCICSGDNSDASDVVSFTPTCSTPGTPVFTSPTADGGHVAWAAAPNVTTYQYCIVKSGEEPDWSGNLTTTNLYYDITGLVPGTNYKFYVRSVCAPGIFSEPVSITCRAAQTTTLRFYDDGELVYTISDAVLPFPTGSVKTTIESAGHTFSACDGYAFYGWVKDAPLIGETSSVSVINSVPASDAQYIDLYAVYSKTENYYQKVTSITTLKNSTFTDFIFVGEYGGKYYAMTNELLTGGVQSGNLSVNLTQSDSYTKYLAGANSVAVTYNNGRITDVPGTCNMKGKYSSSTWYITNSSNYYLSLTANLSSATKGCIKPIFDSYNDYPPTTFTINGTTGAVAISRSQTKSSSTHTWGLYFAPTVSANVIGTSSYSNVFIVCGNNSTQPVDYATYNKGTIYVYTATTATTYKSRCKNYTVHFKACGSGVCSSTSVSNPDRTETNNNGVSMPTVTNVSIACPEIWEYVGWSEQPVPDQTADEPALINSDTYFPLINNISIYAVYRHKTDGELDYYSSYPLCEPFNVFLNPGNGTINGSSDWQIITEETPGAGVILPNTPLYAADAYWKHVGWLTEPYHTAGAPAPAGLLLPDSRYYPSSEGEKLYAVYMFGYNMYWSTFPTQDKCSFILDAGAGKIKENGTVLSVSTKAYSETARNNGLQLQSAELSSTECDVWTFVGWSETKITGGATIQPVTYNAGYRYHPKSLDEDTLFAVYRRGTASNYIWSSDANCTPYNVTLHANGSDNTDAAHFSGTATIEAFEPSIGAGLTFTGSHLPNIGCPERWTFAGWKRGNPIERQYIAPTGLYNTGDTYEIKELGESFYAVYYHQNNGVPDYWTSYPTCDPYTIKIHSCEGTLPGGESEDILTEAIAGGGVVLPTPTPQCDTRGWNFEGWVIGGELSTTTNIGGLTIYPAGKFVPMRNNLELYAVYSIGAYKQVNSILDVNTTDKYAIAIFHDYNGGYAYTDFALTNYLHSVKTKYLNLEPINSYYDTDGVKYVTNPAIQAQWKLEYNGIGANPAYKIKSVATSKYLCFPAHEYSAENDALYSTNGEYHTNANSASEYYYFIISTASGQLSTSRSGFAGEVLSFELGDVEMNSFYSFIGTSSASCRLYRDMGKLYSSWPHCLEYTVYFDGCDGMSTELSKTENYAGLGVTLPSVDDICEDWEFAGWATEPVYNKVTTQTFNIYPAGCNYVPVHNNTTLYAIYVQRSDDYEKISSTDEIFTGSNYVIIYKHSFDGDITNYAVSNGLNSSWGIKPVSVSVAGNQISNPAANIIWNLQGNAGAYTLHNAAAGNYIDLTKSSYAKLSATIYDNINIQQSGITANTFTLNSNITGYYLNGSNLNFGTKDPKSASISTANCFELYRQKVNGLWSYPCSKLIEPMRWGDGEVIVESLDINQAPQSGSLYITDIQPSECGTYTISHTAKRGTRIRIKWGDYKFLMTVPYITTPTSVPTIGYEPKQDLVLLPNSQFVVDQNTTLHNVSIYEDAQLIIEGGSLTIDTLIMRTEGDTTAPSIILGEAGTFNINSGIVFHERRIADDRYYMFTLPFNSILGNLRYTGLISSNDLPIPVYYTDYYLKEYDGQTRAWDAMTGNLKSTYWTHIITKSNASLAPVYELQAGKGYIIALSDINSEHKKRILRFKLNVDDNWFEAENGTTTKVIEVTPSKVDKPINANNAGWNFIGNPYMHNYFCGSADESSGLKTGHYIRNTKGHWVIAADKTQTIPYLTFYNYKIDDYYQTRADNAQIKPFSAVFVQIEDYDQLEFSNPIQAQPAALPAYRRAPQKDDNPTIYTGIKLSSEYNDDKEEEAADRTGLVINNQYTTNYEIGADLAKMMGHRQLHVYTITGGNMLAFNAIDSATAIQPIPVGINIPEQGLYTFSFDDKQYDVNNVKELLLTDYQLGTTVNLLWEDYEFEAEAGNNKTRFAISARAWNKPAITTDTNNAGANAPYSFGTGHGIVIANINEPTDIIIFDMTGKHIYSASRITGKQHIPLPAGIYNILLNRDGQTTILRTIAR